MATVAATSQPGSPSGDAEAKNASGGPDSASDIRIEEEERVEITAEKPASEREVEYRYLTFATPLPPPNTESSRPCGDVVSVPPPLPPPPPDLRALGDPHQWSERRKNVLLALSCAATCLTAYSAGAFSPAAGRMAAAFGVSLTAALAAGITLFCVGFALAPMLLAPLSETNGRYPVFVVSGVVSVVFQVVCGAAPDYAALLVGRLLVGAGSSVFSTMVGGVIADMWHAADRNRPMALFSGAVFVGTGAGPLVAAVIVRRTTAPDNPHDRSTDAGLAAPWRWVFWHQALANALLVLALAVLFRESRGPVLLSRQAAALNAWYGRREQAGYCGVWLSERIDGRPEGRQLRRVRWLVEDDENRTTILRMISVSLYRPFHMLATEPVVFFFSLWVAFAWAVLYLHFGSIFLIFEDTYGWNVEEAGRAFAGMMVGAVAATAMGLYQDRALRALLPARWRRRLSLSTHTPEARLYAACCTSVLLPAGIFLFGWTARPGGHWIGPVVGVGVSTCGILSVYLATFNYLADVYHRFASSALAAQSFCRNVLGGVFPLVMRPLYTNLGTRRASALLGGLALGLTLVPWVLSIFGARIRRRSKFAMSLDH